MRGIYEIKNIETGEIYLGSSRAIFARWETHVHALKKGKHPNRLLQAAWSQHGAMAFTE